MSEIVKKRPTETISGAGAALAVYGFETQVGIPVAIAGPIAVVVLVVPYLVSAVVDALRGDKHAARDAALH